MEIKAAITFEDLVDEFAKRYKIDYFDSERLFIDSYLEPNGCKPACFGKYSGISGKAREFMANLLKELGLERIYIIHEI